MKIEGRLPGIRPGEWIVECQRCGREIWSSEARKEWTGLIVCRDDYEQRNAQEFVRGRADRQSVPNPRAPPQDIFIYPGLWWFTDADQSAEILTAGF